MFGGFGNDDIDGGGGDDYIDGEAGIDDLDGGPNTDACLNGETNTNCEVTGTTGLGATDSSNPITLIEPNRGLVPATLPI